MPAATTTTTTTTEVLPAHETKHLPLLVYPLRDNVAFILTQSNDGANNGTALWLGAQILSVYLSDALPPPSMQSTGPALTSSPFSIPSSTRRSRRLRAVELGSGVGLTSLVLAAQGWSVLATDTPAVVNSILRPNILSNTRNLRLPGTVQIRALDWMVPPETWTWDNPLSIAGTILSDIGETSLGEQEELLGPPFDLILTSDTIYSHDLVAPLLRTLKHLVLLSSHRSSVATVSASPSPASDPKPISSPKQKKSRLPICIALEVRDPALVAFFFSQAHDVWGLGAHRVPMPRVRRAMSHSGLCDWKREDWDGVEVWRLYLFDSQYNEATSIDSRKF